SVLAYNCDFDLAWINHRVVDLASDVVGHFGHGGVVDFLWDNDNANFPTGGYGIGLIDTREGIGDVLEALDSFYIVLDVFVAGARSGTRDSVGDPDDD